MPHICFDELRLLVAANSFATPWLGWLRAWWHHRRAHAKCGSRLSFKVINNDFLLKDQA